MSRTKQSMRGMAAFQSKMASWNLLLVMLLFIEFGRVLASDDKLEEEENLLDYSQSSLGARIKGIQSLLQSHPTMLVGMMLRVTIAVILELNLDAFLKLVVTPFLAASVIGTAAAPLTFFIGQALQPIIHSLCFYGFDDPFVLATLESTGAKRRLASLSKTGEWHKMGTFHRYFMRWCIKTTAGFFLGFAGLFTAIPIAGPIVTALLSGWAVAWDMVYVPLSGMGHVGIFRQARTVLANFSEYYWFGFWAVLIEEIPIAGPACHVYNVYSAAFFLERVYLGNTTSSASLEGLIDGTEL